MTLTPVEVAQIILENTDEQGWNPLLEALQQEIPNYYNQTLVNNYMKVHVAEKVGSEDLITQYFNEIVW